MKTGYNSLIILLFIVLSIMSCRKEEIVDVTKRENLEKVIESEFKRHKMLGLGYAAVKEDSVVIMGAMGFANVHERKDFTPQTRMLIASVSKTMLVTAIMQLYEQGLISLDADINHYLPFHVQNPNYPNDSITVKMLLTHSSTISDDGYEPSIYYLFGYVDYPESLLSFEKNYLTQQGQYYTANNFSNKRPGTSYSYSNVGASLLACIVEQISGTDYNTYCKTHIFQPLGMHRTTWFFSETTKTEIAIPYADYNVLNPSNPFFTMPTYPDGHLITTIEDLSKFMRAYIMNGTFNNYQLLKPQSVDLILQEHAQGGPVKQGLMFFEHSIGNYSVWGHNGGDPGVSTEMYFDREHKIGYIMFNNRTLTYSETLGNALLKYANQ